MYTKWLRIHEEFIKNNTNLSDLHAAQALGKNFGFHVTEDAVKKKRQRMKVQKVRGRKSNKNKESNRDI